jgi:Holliday junction resolvase
MSNNYRKGTDIEYRVMELLERVGYQTARCAGSHGPFDVIAWNHLGMRFIQSKRTERPSVKYDEDIERIQLTPLPPHSTAELWVWLNKGRTGEWIKQEVLKCR